MKRYILCFIGFFCLAVCLSGCSVGMALSGKREPQLQNLRKGMDIEEAHFIMRDYTPSVTFTEEGDRIEEYEIQLGNAPSGGRAIGHGVMDVLTFGCWEVIGTPVEAVTSGKTTVTITYREDRIIKLQGGKAEGGMN